MYDSLKCIFLSASITLFANLQELFDLPNERLGFGALLFLIIWTYMRKVLPKTQEEMERKNNRIAELVDEIRHLNAMREKDQQTIIDLIKDNRQNSGQTNQQCMSHEE